jgi:hypothetical protein
VGKFEKDQITIGWIRNTMELSRLMLTENLRPQIGDHRDLEIVEGPMALPFDSQGDLFSPFLAVHAAAH